jgi:chaperonin GroES
MAEQFPIDPEFGRNIPGIPGPNSGQMEDAQGVPGPEEVELPELTEADIEELPDGSAVVKMPASGPLENEDFYQNLADADDVDSYDLQKIALKYLDLIQKDKESRKRRDEQYEEGIRRTGLGNDAPGGATFAGASKVVHPVMAEACVDFAARAIKEMFPPDGPTKTKILGDVDDEKVVIAERKRDWMNWQLTEQIEEFRDEQEQMLTQLPLGGSQYLKLWYDERKKRPCAEFLPIDNVLLPFAAGNFYTAQRVTEIQDITQYEFKRRIASGLYRDISLIRATAYPEESAPKKANLKVEGKEPDENEDGVRRVYHIYTFLEIEEDKYTKGEIAPYILMIDELDNEVVGLYRNWEEGDESMTKLDWIVEFKFIPWRGAYAVGLPHLIGGLAAALTGSLRALLDSAHINNAATLLKLKGAKVSGQSQQVEITQVSEIEAAPGVDDVRKLAMPMPFNPPSPVLYQLLGWLTNAAKGVVTTAEEKIADVGQNTPVGTTQALIEQGATVFSSIHARLHESQGRVLKVLSRINRWYIDDMKKGDVVSDLDISKDDFVKTTDVIPVSDPHIFSETQRMAQTQAVMAIMQQNPDLFNRKAVISRFLKQIKVPGVNELMIDVPAPEKMDPANENVAMSIGQMAFAYPEQDHLAHIQSHLDFAKDPVFGQNPLIAPAFLPKAMEHIKQHIVLWYLGRAKGYVYKSMNGEPHENYNMVADPKDIDRLYAMAAQHVTMDTEQTLKGILPVLQQMVQSAQKFKPQPPMTADAKVLLDTSMAETQRRAQRDQAEMQLKDKEMAADAEREMARLENDYEIAMEAQKYKMAIAMGDLEMKERIEAARLTRDAARLKLDRDKTDIETMKGVGNE